MPEKRVAVIGAGLAGCEAAWQLSRRGIACDLFDMKPEKRTPAHKSDAFCELVCSNSLRSDRLENAVGLLKEELRELESLVLRCADATRVPAGGALAVDREGFARMVTKAITDAPNINVVHREITEIPDAPCIIATGPLTSDALSASIARLVGEELHFYDAAAPIVRLDSLDMTKACRASRYGRGDDYLNCPMTREEYAAFYRALITAETVMLHEFETPRVFEGCMPVESMAKRGETTLCFGPLKPVGLTPPDGSRPFAVVQLRQDDAAGELYNIVGFQTNLKFAEQKRVFGMIPGLANAVYERYGVMHRNTFLPANVLGWDYQMRQRPGVYFAGQITGVEGYVESASSGCLAGISLARALNDLPPLDFTRKTAIGALAHYVSEYAGSDFQPMNVTFGIMDAYPQRIRNKAERYRAISEQSLKIVKELKTNA